MFLIDLDVVFSVCCAFVLVLLLTSLILVPLVLLAFHYSFHLQLYKIIGLNLIYVFCITLYLINKSLLIWDIIECRAKHEKCSNSVVGSISNLRVNIDSSKSCSTALYFIISILFEFIVFCKDWAEKLEYDYPNSESNWATFWFWLMLLQ